jgi:hypothetical protein
MPFGARPGFRLDHFRESTCTEGVQRLHFALHVHVIRTAPHAALIGTPAVPWLRDILMGNLSVVPL